LAPVILQTLLVKNSVMKNYLLLILASLVLSGCASNPQQDNESSLKEIKETLKTYAALCNAGDFEQWLSLWTEHGVQMPPDAPARVGKEEITQGMKPVFDNMNLDIKITSFEEARFMGNIGLTRCTYSLKATPKAGGEVVTVMADGKALTLYEKQTDGNWKISYDCFNSNISPTN